MEICTFQIWEIISNFFSSLESGKDAYEDESYGEEAIHYICVPALTSFRSTSASQISKSEVIVFAVEERSFKQRTLPSNKRFVIFNVKTQSSKVVLESEDLFAKEMRYLKDGQVIVKDGDKLGRVTLNGESCTFEILEPAEKPAYWQPN